jgi:hypothetical protein
MNGRKRKANGGRGALLRVGEEGSGIMRPRWLMCSRTPVSRARSASCVVLGAAGREPIKKKKSGDPGTRKTRPGVEFSIRGEDGAGSPKRHRSFQPARGGGPSFSDRSVRGSGRAEFHQSRNLGERFDGGRPASSLEDRSPIEPHHSRQRPWFRRSHAEVVRNLILQERSREDQFALHDIAEGHREDGNRRVRSEKSTLTHCGAGVRSRRGGESAVRPLGWGARIVEREGSPSRARGGGPIPEPPRPMAVPESATEAAAARNSLAPRREDPGRASNYVRGKESSTARGILPARLSQPGATRNHKRHATPRSEARRRPTTPRASGPPAAGFVSRAQDSLGRDRHRRQDDQSEKGA